MSAARMLGFVCRGGGLGVWAADGGVGGGRGARLRGREEGDAEGLVRERVARFRTLGVPGGVSGVLG